MWLVPWHPDYFPPDLPIYSAIMIIFLSETEVRFIFPFFFLFFFSFFFPSPPANFPLFLYVSCPFYVNALNWLYYPFSHSLTKNALWSAGHLCCIQKRAGCMQRECKIVWQVIGIYQEKCGERRETELFLNVTAVFLAELLKGY